MCAFVTDGCAGRWDGTTNTSFRKILSLFSKMLTFICQSEYASSCTLHCICQSPITYQIIVKEHFLSFLLLFSDSQNAALQHLFIRKSFRPFKCTHCGKAFRDKDKLDQHLRVHGRDAYNFSCHICNKSFMSDSALEDHLLMHTDNRSFSCVLCPETFERLDLLKEHVGVHAVDGCFTCPLCKKMFTDFIQVSYKPL